MNLLIVMNSEKGYGWIRVHHCSSFQLSLSSLNRTSLIAYDNFYHENFILISLKNREILLGLNFQCSDVLKVFTVNLHSIQLFG